MCHARRRQTLRIQAESRWGLETAWRACCRRHRGTHCHRHPKRRVERSELAWRRRVCVEEKACADYGGVRHQHLLHTCTVPVPVVAVAFSLSLLTIWQLEILEWRTT